MHEVLVRNIKIEKKHDSELGDFVVHYELYDTKYKVSEKGKGHVGKIDGLRNEIIKDGVNCEKFMKYFTSQAIGFEKKLLQKEKDKMLKNQDCVYLKEINKVIKNKVIRFDIDTLMVAETL